MSKYLFICTGNTCRSPLAESYARQKFPKTDISSRGLYVAEDTTNSPSLEILKDEHLPLPSLPQQLTEEDVKDSTLLVMGNGHKEIIKSRWPEANVQLISEYASEETADINDPYGGTKKDYDAVFYQLKHYIDKFKW